MLTTTMALCIGDASQKVSSQPCQINDASASAPSRATRNIGYSPNLSDDLIFPKLIFLEHLHHAAAVSFELLDVL
jgi:hypothetical protein